MAREDLELLDEPVVEWTVDVELESADTVCYMLDGVALTVSVVVHRVDAPAVAGAVMGSVEYAVHDRIAELHVRVSHVDLSTEHLSAVGELASFHPFEEVEVLLDGAVTPGAVLARLGDGAAVGADFFERLVVDISETLLYEEDSPFVELREIVGGVVDAGPVEAQPLDVLHDRLDIFGVLLDGVSVVEAEVGLAAVFQAQAEVEADGFGVTDMEVAVRLGREAGQYRLMCAVSEVVFDYFFEKVQGLIHGYCVDRLIWCNGV